MSSSPPIINFIETITSLLWVSIADKRIRVPFWIMIPAWKKSLQWELKWLQILHFFTNRSIESTDVFGLFRDGGRFFSSLCGNATQRAFQIQSFFDGNTIIKSWMFSVSSYFLYISTSFLLQIRDTKNDKRNVKRLYK